MAGMRLVIGCCVLAAVALAQGNQADYGAAAPHVAAGIKLVQKREYKAALEHFSKAIEAEPNMAQLFGFRGYCHAQLAQHEEALADFDKGLVLAPDDDKIRRSRAQTKGAMGDYAGAEKDYDKLLAGTPSDSGLLSARGSMLAAQHMYDKALTDYTNAIDQNPGNMFAVYRRGMLRLGMADFKGAAKDFGGVLDRNPDHQAAYALRASALLALGKLARGMTDLRTAQLIDAKDPSPSMALARVYWQTGKHDKAIALVDKAVARSDEARAESDPSGHVLFTHARFRFDIGQNGKALALIEKALKAKDNPGEYARLYRFLIHLKAGARERAVKDMNAYLAKRTGDDAWFLKIAHYLVGKIDAKAFLAAAVDDNQHRTRERKAEADWYVGAMTLMGPDQDRATAVKHFQACLASKLVQYIEYDSSAVFLHGLKEGGGEPGDGG